MKSNKDHISSRIRQKQPNLHRTLSKEKEALVTMFLSSATHNELTEQIKKIDELCSKIDVQQRRKPLL
jgi:hypothetical protein